MISRVQGLPTCHVVSRSDLEDVAGGLPNAEGMYSARLQRNTSDTPDIEPKDTRT